VAGVVPSDKLPKDNNQVSGVLLDAHIALQTGKYKLVLYHLARLQPDTLSKKLKAVYFQILGETRARTGQYEEALIDLEQSLILRQSIPKTRPLDIERIRNWIGLVYYYQSRYQQAIDEHLKCLEAINSGRVKDMRFKLKISFNLGNEYHYLGNQTLALQFYHAAREIAVPGDDDTDLAGILWGLGLAYRSNNNLSQAKLWLREGVSLAEKIGDIRLTCIVQSVLGMILVEKGEMEAAGKVLHGSLEIAETLGDITALYNSMVNLAYLYRKMSKPEIAVKYAEFAIEVSRKMNDPSCLGQALCELGDIWCEQEVYEKGFEKYREAEEILENSGDINYLRRTYYNHANALEKTGKLKEAIEYFRRIKSTYEDF
jgi:tetratricopeptide (TPR) repeat protein